MTNQVTQEINSIGHQYGWSAKDMDLVATHEAIIQHEDNQLMVAAISIARDMQDWHDWWLKGNQNDNSNRS
jgi:hypothetical protein